MNIGLNLDVVVWPNTQNCVSIMVISIDRRMTAYDLERAALSKPLDELICYHSGIPIRLELCIIGTMLNNSVSQYINHGFNIAIVNFQVDCDRPAVRTCSASWITTGVAFWQTV